MNPQKRAATIARKAEILCEELEWQMECRVGWYQAMKAIGYDNPASLFRRLHRAGRPDLAAIYEAAAQHNKAKKAA